MDTERDRNTRRASAPLVLGYAIVCYAAAIVVLGYAIGFIAGAGVPSTVDRGVRVSWPLAAAIDLALLLVFALQHTVMARPAVKRRLTELLPRAAERSTFVLCASLALALLCWQWRPITAVVWHVHGAGAVVLSVGYAAGWALAVAATFMISHADLFGLRQAWLRARGDRYEPPAFTQRGLYSAVRHPLMTGFLIVFWVTPVMTAGHLLLAAASTGYILIGIRFEERDLSRDLGAVYARYRAHVPALVPGMRPRSRPDGSLQAGGVR